MQHMKLLEISSREHPVCPERDIGTAPGKWGKRGSGDRTPKSLIGKSASNPERKGAGGGGARGYTLGENCTEYLNPPSTIQHLNIIPCGRCA